MTDEQWNRFRTASQAVTNAGYLVDRQDSFYASMPSRYARATLADLPVGRRRALEAWSAARSPWALILTGSPGVGKTHAACALCVQEAGANQAAEFVSWQAWVEAKKAAMDSHAAPSDLAYFDGLLVIDDLAAGRMTEYVAGLLCLVVSEREAEMRRTLITTNASLEDFGAVDGRLGSRLSGAKWISFTGDDLRQTVPTPSPAPRRGLPPPPETADEVATEAERQGLAGFEAELFFRATAECRISPHRECTSEWQRRDWRRWLAPWMRIMADPELARDELGIPY